MIFCMLLLFFFFKQKTAYEMRISDWSSDVCSSDLQATKADYDRLPEIKDHKTRVYGAMIAQLDRRIGDVMAKLKEAGIDDDTLVIFTSDNGGAWYNGMQGLNAPFRGWKARSEEHTSELQSLMRKSYAVFCLKQKNEKILNY